MVARNYYYSFEITDINSTAVVVEDEQDGITRTNELLSKLLDKVSDLSETGGKTNE